MPIRDVFKVSRKTYFNPLGWMGYDSLKDQNSFIWSNAKQAFVKPTLEHKESFAEAMKRLELTDAAVRKQARDYKRYALIFVALGFLAFYYAFYLLFRYHTILSWVLGMGVACLFFVHAYKYDFWSYQMRARKLGATFKEWKKHYGY